MKKLKKVVEVHKGKVYGGRGAQDEGRMKGMHQIWGERSCTGWGLRVKL